MSDNIIKTFKSVDSKIFEITKMYLENTVNLKSMSAIEFAKKFADTHDTIKESLKELKNWH